MDEELKNLVVQIKSVCETRLYQAPELRNDDQLVLWIDEQCERWLELSVEATSELDRVYTERNALVCALSKLFPSNLMRHPEDDKEWDNEWRWIVCIAGPTGQLTWHLHDRELPMFTHLEMLDENNWDGHTTEEKYKRLAEVPIA